MKTKNITLFIFLLFLSLCTFAQKLKYKDIYALLEKKKYEAAEPMLVQFLQKAPDNANALLYMGIIKMDKYYKLQPQDAQAAKKEKDEAISFLQQAKLNLDKKEVAKNEKYYQAYRRRDVRTGTFETSLSDIVTDIEKRIDKLREGN